MLCQKVKARKKKKRNIDRLEIKFCVEHKWEDFLLVNRRDWKI